MPNGGYVNLYLFADFDFANDNGKIVPSQNGPFSLPGDASASLAAGASTTWIEVTDDDETFDDGFQDAGGALNQFMAASVDTVDAAGNPVQVAAGAVLEVEFTLTATPAGGGDPIDLLFVAAGPGENQGDLTFVVTTAPLDPNATYDIEFKNDGGGTPYEIFDYAVPDYIVEGTEDDDLIDENYTGDPERDMIDAGDNAAGNDDDVVLAGAGNDTVQSGEGDDLVYGGSGNDLIDGGVGNDTLIGDGADEQGSATITFEYEEAGYLNSMGVYYIDPQTGELVNPEIAFENTSAVGSGGELIPGVSAYTYANIPEGAEVGVFTITNGANVNDFNALGEGTYEFRDPATGGPATVDTTTPELVHIAPNGTETVLNGDIYHTAGHGPNADLNPDGQDHFQGVSENPDGSVTLGVEDINFDGDPNYNNDMDFNDPVFTVALDGPGLSLNNGSYDVSTPPGSGGSGDDTIFGGDGSDSVIGGGGDDVIDTSSKTGIPLPDLGYPGLFPADSDVNDDKDTVDGGAGDDIIITGDDADLIDGGTGNDTIDAGIDADTIEGGDGDDLITASEGSDLVSGGDGNDTIYGGLGPNYPDSLNIPDDIDLVPDNGKDTIDGGAGDDVIFGEDDDDVIYGGEGADLIDAGIDDDTVFGGAGNDTITGGKGEDSLFGGEEDKDTFLGGNEGDYVYGGSGVNTDFDTLDLTGAAEDANPGGSLNVVYDANPENGTVVFRDVDGKVTGTMRFEEIEKVIPCFTPGTMIATPTGERPAETLKVGDQVITRDSGIQEIRWMGQRAFNGVELARAPHLKPIMIRKGALGNDLPERDMLVSPNHRMLVANDRTSLYFDEHEVLVAAKHLVNHRGIQQLNSLSTTYVHFMFDHHEVVLSDGAWTESFQPGDYTLKGMGNAQRGEIFEIFPDLETVKGLEDYTAARRTLKRHEAALLQTF